VLDSFVFRRESFLRSLLWTSSILAFVSVSPSAQVSGSVDSWQKISDLEGGFGLDADAGDSLGSSVVEIGDLDGDGVSEIAVGVVGDDDGASEAGCVWILFLNTDGAVASKQKISVTQGGFGGTLSTGCNFGRSVAGLGDLDGNGTVDLAVGAPGDDDGGVDQGAVWILFLNPDGTVSSETKISEIAGGFSGVLDPQDDFGHSLARLGDLDGDGITDLAVGAWGDDDGGIDQGAVWILFLNANGTVASSRKISEIEGAFGGDLFPGDSFGASVFGIGDLDGDLVTELAVGAPGYRAVWILFLFPDGTVASEQKIDSTHGGFGGLLSTHGFFGEAVAALDLDGDPFHGLPELVVGEPYADGGGTDVGAVWILFLNADGTVRSERKITTGSAHFGGALVSGNYFGGAVSLLDDINGDGVEELVVGAPFDDDSFVDSGAVWVLSLTGTGKLQKISSRYGDFGAGLDPNDRMGISETALGDLDGNGVGDLAVGAYVDDDGATDQGAVWILFMNAECKVASKQKISETQGGFGGVLDPSDRFGQSVAALGDLDGNGTTDLAVGAPNDDDGGTNQGAVWILFLNANGTVASQQKISASAGGLGGVLHPGDGFGLSVAALGDLDGNGRTELAVGAFLDDDGGADQGAVWILFLNANGTVATQQKISETSGGFGGALDPSDEFGISVTALGDLDRDGTRDLAVGAQQDDDGGADQGAVWMLFLNADGTVEAWQKISELAGGFGGNLHAVDLFGSGVAALGDLGYDGVTELAVGAQGDEGGGIDEGAVWILSLRPSGTVRSWQKINGFDPFAAINGPYPIVLDNVDDFGRSLAAGDFDGDGRRDLAVGAPDDDDAGTDKGAVWILSFPANKVRRR